jgi:hypothetical protein
VLSAAALLAPARADGADLHVANSGSPPCSDSPAAGSEANPYCTIGYGLGRITGGSRLYVHAGTYDEALYIAGPAGTAGSPTVIQAYPGDTVTVRGTGVDSGRVKIVNTSYITLDGFIVTNFNQGIFVESSDHIEIKSSVVTNIGQEGIHVHYGSSYVTIDACTVHDTGVWQYDGEAIYLGTGDSAPLDDTNNVTVRNSTIYNATNEGIELKIGTHHITVENNTIHHVNTADNGYGGAAIEVNQAVGSVQHYDGDPGHIVRNNLVHDVGPATGAAYLRAAIRAGTGGAYYNNVIWNVTGDGISADNQSKDSYTRAIYHNTVDVPESRAVVISGATADVKNNIGPSAANNLPTSSAYYVDGAKADYHLAPGSAPIDAGLDLTSVVATDIEGRSRSASGRPDLGAYELAVATDAAGEDATAPPVAAPEAAVDVASEPLVAAPEAGVAGGTESPSEDGGCGCRTSGTGRTPCAALVLAAAFWSLFARRRSQPHQGSFMAMAPCSQLEEYRMRLARSNAISNGPPLCHVCAPPLYVVQVTPSSSREVE